MNPNLANVVLYLGSTSAQVWAAVGVFLMLLIRDSHSSFERALDELRFRKLEEVSWMARPLVAHNKLDVANQLVEMRSSNETFRSIVKRLNALDAEQVRYTHQQVYPPRDTHYAKTVIQDVAAEMAAIESRYRDRGYRSGLQICFAAIAVCLFVLLCQAFACDSKEGELALIALLAITDAVAMTTCVRLSKPVS
jgi:hypothetical protein